jgi:PadR family transcriptional regulator PadR
MKGEWLKGHLDFLILATIENKPAHGYAITIELRRRSAGAFDLAEGTLYPALHRLEHGGLLASRWTRHQGRRRRIYRLTARGRRALVDHRRQWAIFSGAIAAVLEPAR